VIPVVLDIRATSRTGVARYGRNLAVHGAERFNAAGLDVHVLLQPAEAATFPASARAGLTLVPVPAGEDARFVRQSEWVRSYVRRLRPALYYATGYHLDPDIPAPYVFTVHDFTRLTFPEADARIGERFGPGELAEMARLCGADVGDVARGTVFGRYFAWLTRRLAARAVGVATVSHAVAGQIGGRLGIPAGRISVVPSAVDPVFRPRAQSEVALCRGRLSLSEPFALYVGLARPHKRLDWLIRQFAAMPPGAGQLVLAGGHAEAEPAVQSALRGLAGRERVLFSGRVMDDELAVLYTGAALTVSASTSEGFGLPPAEAMACGCEVAVTDIAAHREVLGQHAHYFPPGDGTALRGLLAAGFDGRLQRERRSTGFTPPSWASAAEALVRSVQKALDWSRRDGWTGEYPGGS
jgi:glycosyltransferase involved in cell wall biosynthesis